MPGKRKVLLKRLKDHKTIWHPESTLVFKSQKERLIIGRYSIETEELISLDDITLELCNEWKFIPDPELLISSGGETDGETPGPEEQAAGDTTDSEEQNPEEQNPEEQSPEEQGEEEGTDRDTGEQQSGPEEEGGVESGIQSRVNTEVEGPTQLGNRHIHAYGFVLEDVKVMCNKFNTDLLGAIKLFSKQIDSLEATNRETSSALFQKNLEYNKFGRKI